MNPPYDTTDFCAGFWRDLWDAGFVHFPPHARVLEIGCAEYDWQTPMLQVRPDLQITGIDWRPVTRPGDTVVGDVLTHEFPEASFDAIVAVSTVEHVGLGYYRQDPIDDDGDTNCMERCRRWLKPGGWMYLDVPYRPSGPLFTVTAKYRAYNDAALGERLLHGWDVVVRYVCGTTEKDGPYIALVLEQEHRS